ncbi:MAG: exo-alpha-sialidase [Clostridia bacterium]|nr:exo-alpha-sialidase [Clostridia bacterium]
MEFLANEFVEIYRTEKGKKQFCYTPAICVLDSGRYIFSGDVGGNDATELPGYDAIPKNPANGRVEFGQIFTSDDKGKTWQRRAVRNFCHARPFAVGNTVYLLGHSGDLVIYKSEDAGETWDNGTFLTQNEEWHQSACAYHMEDGVITLVMETVKHREGDHQSGWYVANLCPVVMRARLSDDLTKKESWTFSNKVCFRDVLDVNESDLFGVPFYTPMEKQHLYKDEAGSDRYFCQNPGWLETNVVKITDEKHYWCDKTGKTFHLFMRAHTAGSGFCCLMKAVVSEENGKEIITVMPQENPSGKKVIFLPMPGGQMRFHILYDEKTKLYWLLSTQCTDSMTRIELLSSERYNIPCDERDRLQLSFSKNMVDWCFAGIVAKGDSEKQSRHYACMAIDGDDLVIVSRSGDKDAFSAHNGNMATFHRVKDFRSLVY